MTAPPLVDESRKAEEVGGFIDIYVVAFLSAVGVTNQRETTLVWDKETGEPLYNAIGLCIMYHNVSVPKTLTYCMLCCVLYIQLKV